VRFGEYKSAPEAFERTSSSEPARREHEELIDDYMAQLGDQIAADRPIRREDIPTLVDRGPFTAPEAVQEKLVDAMVYEDQIDLGLRRAFGRDVRLAQISTTPERPRRWTTPGRIAVIYVDGNIVDGRSYTIPLLDMRFAGGRTIVEAIQQAASDPSVRAIVLRIDSPGGPPGERQMWRALWRARQVKPVVASMESIAASGGYYIASAAQHIVASPGHVDGLHRDLLRQGRRVRAHDASRRRRRDALARRPRRQRFALPPVHHRRDALAAREDAPLLQHLPAQGRARARHDERRARRRDRARSRVSGRQARARGLVDSYGGIAEALWKARQLAGLPRITTSSSYRSSRASCKPCSVSPDSAPAPRDRARPATPSSPACSHRRCAGPCARLHRS